MRCAFCEQTLAEEYYIAEIVNVKTQEYTGLHMCSGCMTDFIRKKHGPIYKIDIKRQFVPKQITRRPLRAFAKPQVNGLF